MKKTDKILLVSMLQQQRLRYKKPPSEVPNLLLGTQPTELRWKAFLSWLKVNLNT
jgi:hypothetical protein